MELRIVPLEFSALLAGMSEGKYDMAISALAYSPERGGKYESVQGLLFRRSRLWLPGEAREENRYDSIDSLKDAVVVTQSGSVQEALYREQVGSCREFKLVSSMTDGYLMVAEERRMCICSTGSAKLYAEANGGLAIPDFAFPVNADMQGTRGDAGGSGQPDRICQRLH